MHRYLLLLLLIVPAVGTAQPLYPPCSFQQHKEYQVLDTVRYTASYIYSTYRDPEHPEMRDSDVVWLEIGDSVTKLYSRPRWVNDSLVQIVIDKGARNYRPLHQWCMHEIIIRGYREEDIWTYQDLWNEKIYTWREPPPALNWRMEEGAREILGYACRKATLDHRGRHYTAWYAPDIPLPYGPWSFHGLPGLILAIQDDTGRVAFTANGFWKARPHLPLLNYFARYVKTTREKAREFIDIMHRRPYLYVGEKQAQGNSWLKKDHNLTIMHTWVELE